MQGDKDTEQRLTWWKALLFSRRLKRIVAKMEQDLLFCPDTLTSFEALARRCEEKKGLLFTRYARVYSLNRPYLEARRKTDARFRDVFELARASLAPDSPLEFPDGFEDSLAWAIEVSSCSPSHQGEHAFLRDFSSRLQEILAEKEAYRTFEKGISLEGEGYVDFDRGQAILKAVRDKALSLFPDGCSPDLERLLSQDIEPRRERHNREFEDEAIKNPVFDDINGRSLSEEQRRAAVVDERHTLVSAPAGSGKTLLLLGKIRYLIQSCGVDPRDILFLSFSKRTVEEANRKLALMKVPPLARTFHSEGLAILKKAQGILPDVEEQMAAIVTRFLLERILPEAEPDIENLLLFTSFPYAGLDPEEFSTLGEYRDALRGASMLTAKEMAKRNGTETVHRERVKSFEELQIANFYAFHGVRYEYEAPYPFVSREEGRRAYRPDFTLVDYPGVFHEHYGLSRDGVPRGIPEEERAAYLEDMAWKVQTHQDHGTRCIQTYSHEFEDGTWQESLLRQWGECGVKTHPMSPEQWRAFRESAISGRAFRDTVRILTTFLALYAEKYADESGFEDIEKEIAKSLGRRFLRLVKDCYLFYEESLEERGRIDFPTMISMASLAVKDGGCPPYRFIIVDEYQDISEGRFRLLNSLLEHSGAHLFAVGDDYQAIYRFSGSDLCYFLHFESLFPHAAKRRIATTYRYGESTLEATEAFMQKDPEYGTRLSSTASAEKTPILFRAGASIKEAFCSAIETILAEDPAPSILVITRRKDQIRALFDIEGVVPSVELLREGKGTLTLNDAKSTKVTCLTAHAAKGLEADYAIVLASSPYRFEFPCDAIDHPILSALLPKGERYPLAEERRIWYVALTRAKKATIVLSTPSGTSPFVEEMTVSRHVEDFLCPTCHRPLVSAHVGDKEILRCPNYPYCDYVLHRPELAYREKKCPRCGDYLVKRVSQKTGDPFLGCNRYPRCRHTEPLPEGK